MGCYRIDWKQTARKELRRLDKLDMARVLAAVEGLADQPGGRTGVAPISLRNSFSWQLSQSIVLALITGGVWHALHSRFAARCAWCVKSPLARWKVSVGVPPGPAWQRAQLGVGCTVGWWQLSQLAAEATSPMTEIREGVSAFLDVCVDGDFQRIVLVDGPRVLGSDAWEELVEQYGRGILEEWLERCVGTGDLDHMPLRALARLLIAMLTEASLAIARSGDPLTERVAFGETLDRILLGLRPPAANG